MTGFGFLFLLVIIIAIILGFRLFIKKTQKGERLAWMSVLSGIILSIVGGGRWIHYRNFYLHAERGQLGQNLRHHGISLTRAEVLSRISTAQVVAIAGIVLLVIGVLVVTSKRRNTHAPIRSASQSLIGEGEVFCSHCGTKQPSDGKFCTKCGQQSDPVQDNRLT